MTQDKRFARISWTDVKPGGEPTNGTEAPAHPLETVVLPIQLELELKCPHLTTNSQRS